MPRPTKTRARERIQRVLDAIPDLKQLRRGSPEFEKWHRDTPWTLKQPLNTSFDSAQNRHQVISDVIGVMGVAVVTCVFTLGLKNVIVD